MEENWRDVLEFEGLYQASNLGRIRSLRFGKMKILKLNLNPNGYLYVNLCKERKLKTCTVHRLVAMAFIPNPDNLPMINHKDECKTNNIPENLEWCDASYNNSYGTLPERQSQNKLNDPIKSKPVLQFTIDGRFVGEWSSTNECGRNGFNQGAVSACCLGKRKSHKGFIWMYAEDFFKLLPEI